MAKDKRKRKRGGSGGGGGGGPTPEAMLAELEATAGEIAAAESAQTGPLWGACHKLLLKLKADPADAARVIATREVADLTRLLAALRGDEPPPPAEPEPEATPAVEVPAEEMKKAMRAFRKRIKLVRLDHESKLGVGPMTGGKKADFEAIMAPQEFPAEVWKALAAEGKLKAAGPGFYMLPDEDA